MLTYGTRRRACLCLIQGFVYTNAAIFGERTTLLPICYNIEDVIEYDIYVCVYKVALLPIPIVEKDISATYFFVDALCNFCFHNEYFPLIS